MPIYEYQCNACGHQLEAFQKMSEAPLTDCPECKKNTLTKLVSAAGFQLKGTGWYVTDFRNKGKPDTTKNSTTSSTSSTSSDQSKSDTGSTTSQSTDSTSKGDKT
jgi:putative FmdB family regulatory protein